MHLSPKYFILRFICKLKMILWRKFYISHYPHHQAGDAAGWWIVAVLVIVVFVVIVFIVVVFFVVAIVLYFSLSSSLSW